MFAATGCGGSDDPGKLGDGAAPITVRSGSEIELAGSLYAPSGESKAGVVLIHGAGGDRSEWGDFGQRLVASGYMCLAIDLAGHGASRAGRLDYATFDRRAWEDRASDVRAAVRTLIESRCDPENIGVVGADIGATLALRAAVDGGIQSIILVSPLLESHGLSIESRLDAVRRIPVLILASEGDTYSATSGRSLKGSMAGFCEYRLYPGSLHGADLIVGSESAAQQALQWLEQTLPLEKAR